jgi:Family of unknown function (DUF5706)
VTKPPDSEDYAWRIHGALDSWTGKVDTKASIALAVESAVLGFALAQSEKGKALAGLDGAARCWYHLGLALVVVSIACALWVVFPRLRRWRTRRGSGEWKKNTIYFGHLRHWDPDELAPALNDAYLSHGDQLAAQLVRMSKIAWSKHSWLQGSLIAFAVGGVCLLVVAYAG